MNKFLSCVIFVPAIAGLTLTHDISAGNRAGQPTPDGLQLADKSRHSEFYVRPDLNWGEYSAIQLQDASVAFRSNWQRDQNRSNPLKVNAEDMAQIANSLSAQFRKVFTEELSNKGGYNLAATAGEHVLLVKPVITNLDVVAPDTRHAGFSRQYADSTTRMTLRLEFYDSVTGQLLATSSDRLEDPRRGYLKWTTNVSNRADSDRMLRQWATDLRQRLEEARGDNMAFTDKRQDWVRNLI